MAKGAKDAKEASYWLIKSEPSKYSYAKLVADGKTVWDGIRSFEARNNMRAMKKGELALFYHSNEGKEVVGVARVLCEAYQDPTTDEDWSVVEFGPAFPLREPVTLAAIKKSAKLSKMALVKKSRLSVAPVTRTEFVALLTAAKTKVPS
jgi:predicted RNA-binding protein with PUA-like domain